MSQIDILDVAARMSQELQDFVDEAVEDSGDEKALWSVQLLLREWNEAMAARRAWGER